MATNKRVNILVYAGPGSTLSSVRHATWSLRRLVGPQYAVVTVTGDQILKEPWTSSCALLVMPGGADMGYCRILNGEGNRRIKQYVAMGGAYLGLCAGGYYGSAKCEFEVGKVKEGMEVVGSRELAFFAGICRGLAFPGFVYHSEAGTRAAEIKVNKEGFASSGGTVPEGLRTYYNGGGVFADATSYKTKGVEVLASYTDDLAVESDGDKAAVVFCKVGGGKVILTGPHPEYACQP
jgi:biotin---protein ligase